MMNFSLARPDYYAVMLHRLEQIEKLIEDDLRGSVERLQYANGEELKILELSRKLHDLTASLNGLAEVLFDSKGADQNAP